jgi:predicted outer membrane protein
LPWHCDAPGDQHDAVSDRGHKSTAEFRQAASSGSDPALKAYAQHYLPMQEQHLQMAESVAQTVTR